MLDEDNNPAVKAMYEKWVYPPPIEDLEAYRAAGNYQICDPSHLYHRLWPDRPRGPLSILVAGCGSSQSAILAMSNPDCEVVGIDISRSSLARTEALKARHGLDNLTIRELSLHQAAELGRTFDLVLCTGVLHHLPDPPKGARALKPMLKPDGVMTVMLYGYSTRTGVYMLQRAFRAAGLERTDEDLLTVKTVLAALPQQHTIWPYMRSASDLKSDEGLVDTFLNAQDRAYTVPDVFEFVDQAEMRFLHWVQPWHYEPEALLPRAVCERLKVRELDPVARAIIAESVTQTIGRQMFSMVLPDAPTPEISFEGKGWLDYVPTLALASGVRAGQYGDTFEIFRPNDARPVGANKAKLLGAVTGDRTILDCVMAVALYDRVGVDEVIFNARSIFHELWRDGYVHLLVGDAAKAAAGK